MDLWEANNAATQLTPHPCNYNTSAPYLCQGTECGGSGICDQPGCEYNPYRQGNTNFYGAGKQFTINTLKPFTVVTQFITNDGTAHGQLTEIRRFYKQNGRVYANPASKVSGLKPYNSISDQYCTDQKKAFNSGTNTFAAEGGMKQFSKSIANGMVLVFSIWDDASGGMSWLDESTGTGAGSARGPCSATSGNTTMIQQTYPGAKVTWSNIKTGDLFSTF
jgi:cellulose 1,4-beta-cellobiosidase